MAKYQIEYYKKKIILSGLFFLAIWLLLSNNSPFRVKYQELFPNTPRLEINLSNDFLIVLGIIFPFIFLIGMNLLIFFHYSNQVTKKSARRLLKMVMLLMIIFLFYITIDVATQPVEEPLVANSTSSTISTTFISTTTPIIINTTVLPTTTTLPQSSTVNTSSITPPQGLNELVSFLSQNMIYIVIVFGLIFVIINSMRPSVPSERKKLKKLLDSDPNIRKFKDKPREHIISSYLYASRILEELGANDDYSLTPIEFQNDVKNKFRNEENYWSQFPELTYWYEVARFSSENIPEKAVKEVNEAVNRLNKLVNKVFDNITTQNKKKSD